MVGRIHTRVRNQWMGALALFLVVAGGGAYAAFDPVGGDGDVDACFQRKSGDLDLLKGKKCGKKEKPVTWSQVGPTGEPGEQGTKGDPGANGLNGSARAYGRVSGQGVVDTARSTPGATASRVAEGTYCVTVPGLSNDNAVIVPVMEFTFDDSNTGDTAAAATGGGPCSSGSFPVVTFNAAGTSDDAGFNFLIP